MSQPFDSFVIFAEMRTGSNFLESNLDLFPGLKTYGEAFNPYFMVRPKLEELFGVTIEMRNADPLQLLEKMKENTGGIPGFRFFHDHDRRVFEAIIDDPRCAKVVLTRNFVDAYVSRRIARATGQWALGNVRDAKKQKVQFDPEEFTELYARISHFQGEVQTRLQRSGQTAFYLDYEDTQNLDVINGLAAFLGETTRLEKFSDRFKKQNPERLEDKVANYSDLVKAVQQIDFFDIGRAPVFEPHRAPAVPSYVTAAKAPLLFMPVPGAPVEEIYAWLAALDDVGVEALTSSMSQKDMRKWKREHPGHRSFTILRHPAERAHATFCRLLLSDGAEAQPELRQALIEQYGVPLPEDAMPDPDYDRVAHRTAFLAYLAFVKANLTGQTAIRVEGAWASQGQVIRGFGQVLSPDHVLRESQLEEGLAHLCDEVGVKTPPAPLRQPDTPFTLADIYDDKVEEAVRAAYQRDYMLFGFGRWNAEPGRG